jgi:hypothetical protein
MAIIYRTAGGWGAGKGSNLTAAEVDGNFWDLHGRVDTLETTPPAPNNIDDITVSGSQMTITMEDASTFGPFTLPTARWRWRDTWEDATVYTVNDFFRDDEGNVYLVLIGHTSAAPFDPDLESSGNPVYELILDVSTIGSGSAIVTVATTTYTLLAENAGGYHTCTHASGCTVSLEAETTGGWTAGMEFHFRQSGAAQVEIDPVSGVTISAKSGSTYKTAEFGSVITIKYMGSDTWHLFGDDA